MDVELTVSLKGSENEDEVTPGPVFSEHYRAIIGSVTAIAVHRLMRTYGFVRDISDFAPTRRLSLTTIAIVSGLRPGLGPSDVVCDYRNCQDQIQDARPNSPV